jgi:tetratricopeptide (TPR) repeat protein
VGVRVPDHRLRRRLHLPGRRLRRARPRAADARRVRPGRLVRPVRLRGAEEGRRAARKQLATALENKGRTDEAIAAWLEYGKLRPKDANALRHLGDLELGQANQYFQQAQLAALAQAEASAGSTFRPTFGQDTQADPLIAAQTTNANTALQTASTKYQTAASRAIATYQQISKLQPKNQEALFALAQAADTLHQTAAAVAAYRKLLKLDLDTATKAQIRARIKTLQAGSQG